MNCTATIKPIIPNPYGNNINLGAAPAVCSINNLNRNPIPELNAIENKINKEQ